MVVLRQDGDLTLVNRVRLDGDGEAALTALGTVRHAVRLGAFHGMDDAYVVDHLGAEFWCQAGSDRFPRPVPTHAFDEGVDLPIGDASAFVFRHARLPSGPFWCRATAAC